MKTMKWMFALALAILSIATAKEAVMAEGHRIVDMHYTNVYNLADSRFFVEVWKVGEEYESHYYLGSSLVELRELDKGENWQASNSKCGCGKIVEVVSGTFKGENPPSRRKNSCNVLLSECIYTWVDGNSTKTYATQMTLAQMSFHMEIWPGGATISISATPAAVLNIEKLWDDFVKNDDRCSIAKKLFDAETDPNTQMDIINFSEYLKDSGVDLIFASQYRHILCAK